MSIFVSQSPGFRVLNGHVGGEIMLVGLAGTSIMIGNGAAAFNATNQMTACQLMAGLGAEIAWGLGKRGAVACFSAFGGAYITDANGTNPANLLEVQIPRMIANECDVAFICVGTNECGDTLRTQADMDLYMSQITNGVNTLVASGVRPIFVNLPPRDSSANSRANVKLFNQNLAKLCLRLNLAYIDLFSKCAQASGDWIAGYSSDGVHLTSETGFALVGESLRADAMGALSQAVGISIPTHSSIMPVGAPSTIGATGPAGYTGLHAGGATGVHAAESPAGAGTGSQLFPGVAWRHTITAATQEARGIFRASGGSFTFTPGGRHLFFAWTKVAACEFSDYGSSAVKPIALLRWQMLNAANSNIGRIDLFYCNVGQEWNTWRYIQIACWLPALAEKYDFMFGTLGPNTTTSDLSIGGWGAIRI